MSTKSVQVLRRVGPLLVAAVLVAGCGSVSGRTPAAAPTPPTSSPSTLPYGLESVPSPSPLRCPKSGIAVRAGMTEAAMGLRVLRLELLNCGRKAVTLNGYPSVRLRDADRTPLRVTVGRGSSSVASVASMDRPPRPVRLRKGRVAMASLLWRNLYTDPSVPPLKGVYLEVVPAPGEKAQTVQPSGGIDLGSTTALGVSPWEPAKGLSSSGTPRPAPLPS